MIINIYKKSNNNSRPTQTRSRPSQFCSRLTPSSNTSSTRRIQRCRKLFLQKNNVESFLSVVSQFWERKIIRCENSKKNVFFFLGARRSRLVVRACTDPGDSEKEKPEKNDKFCSALDTKHVCRRCWEKPRKLSSRTRSSPQSRRTTITCPSQRGRWFQLIYKHPNIQREEMSSPKWF